MEKGFSLFYENFRELLDACTVYYKENADNTSSARILQNRSKLSHYAEVFHEQCGTLTSPVQHCIEDLRRGYGIVLMTAHQPNLFAYSGVLRKATLNFVLAEELRKRLDVPVVSLFGIADQDFSDDKWVRSCQLPAIQRSDGIISMDAKLPLKLVLKKVAKPSRDLLKKWKNEIDKWFKDTACSVVRLLKETSSAAASFPSSKLRENLDAFWNVVEDSYDRAQSYSDFNAFVMSRIVNGEWGYDTLFLRFSESQRIFCEDFNFLLSHFHEYSNSLKEAIEVLGQKGKEEGVSVQEPQLAPFWYECVCGSKAKLFLRNEHGSLIGEGSCFRCGQNHVQRFGAQNDPDMSSISSHVSARAISMNLVFFRGLMPSCYVGGAAGAGYLEEARYVAKRLGLPFPPTVIWRPHDKYLGLAQMEALLEARRICTNLRVNDACEARRLLEARMLEIHAILDSFEHEKKESEEQMKENFGNCELKEKVRQISIERTKAERASNLPVIAHELKILRNVEFIIKLIPSIVDYAINIGLRETSHQWVQFLERNGSLTAEVNLKSVMDRFAEINIQVAYDEYLRLYGGAHLA